jgi:hypothetical protein
VVILGLIVYFWHSTRMFVSDALPLLLMIFVAEEQGTVDIQVPSYVTQRGEIESEISEIEKQGVV